MGKIGRAVDYEPVLLESLKDPEYAAEFINTALEEYVIDGDIKAFNLALKYLLKSQNITQVANEINISRQQIHRILAGTSKPTFDLLTSLFKGLGYQFYIKPIN